MMYVVYILKNNDTGKHYIGYIRNLERRLKEHSRGKTRSLKKIKNFSLIYREECESKQEAYKKEKLIKRYKGGNAFKKLLKSTTKGR